MHLGRYRLEEQVGQGGMAVVWRGFDTQLRRTVAVKVLHPHLHAREEIRRRFDREAQAVARLHHRHILDVYDFSGLAASPSYLVTEYIRGHTLRAFADAHPFDPPELAAACLLPIAEALVHAHAAGVVHRDLKPENIMVREDGLLKLTDFGIAALLDPEERFTATGSILGSPSHLAPETIEGKPADPRSDLFSFGTILYWLCCGQLPFAGATPASLLRAILDGRHTDPRMLRRSVSDGLARIIERCLAVDPADRYQSAGEVVRDLSAELTRAGIDDPAQEVAAFVRSRPPEEHAALLRNRLVTHALGQAQEAQRKDDVAGALAGYSRVLSLDPHHAQASLQVGRIRRRASWLRRLRKGALAAGVAALCAAFGLWANGLRLRRAQAEKVRAHEASLAAAAQARAATRPQTAAIAPPPPSTSSSASPAVSTPKPHRLPRSVAAADVSAPKPSSTAGKLSVELKPQLPAQVIVDGRDLGIDVLFRVELSPGEHQVVVRHQFCCEDGQETVNVTPNRTRYPLQLGAPRSARLKVVGASPDAPLEVDGVVVGTVSNPQSFSMTTVDRKARIRVGDRVGVSRLQAGRDNVVDYGSLGVGP